ncbi:Aste57867_23279 [Aphanomyces stellatus]|uniref:Aste57867_23279 protein n=1 Tax=Aphanomyces stellatus TaxID=120398 RepID=A0A485LRX6_9STRA|nr:hypothetical protein As57867_023208 [Aphanomyces stellatus]VFT99924.1 Aste57867_23279 [Aphanomyces stellatus]
MDCMSDTLPPRHEPVLQTSPREASRHLPPLTPPDTATDVQEARPTGRRLSSSPSTAVLVTPASRAELNRLFLEEEHVVATTSTKCDDKGVSRPSECNEESPVGLFRGSSSRPNLALPRPNSFRIGHDALWRERDGGRQETLCALDNCNNPVRQSIRQQHLGQSSNMAVLVSSTSRADLNRLLGACISQRRRRSKCTELQQRQICGIEGLIMVGGAAICATQVPSSQPNLSPVKPRDYNDDEKRSTVTGGPATASCRSTRHLRVVHGAKQAVSQGECERPSSPSPAARHEPSSDPQSSGGLGNDPQLQPTEGVEASNGNDADSGDIINCSNAPHLVPTASRTNLFQPPVNDSTTCWPSQCNTTCLSGRGDDPPL